MEARCRTAQVQVERSFAALDAFQPDLVVTGSKAIAYGRVYGFLNRVPTVLVWLYYILRTNESPQLRF